MVDAGAPVPAALDDSAAAVLLPERRPRAHKGSHGTLVCIAGSLDYAGAALLAGLAAARAGAGLVALAVPASLQPVIAGRVPELVTLGLPEHAGPAAALAIEQAHELISARRPTALLIGPGLREQQREAALLLALLADPAWPAVLDGGALNLLAASGDWWSEARAQCVLTPHPGEFARLAGADVGADDGERAERCAAAAQKFGQVVVLKGAGTVIAGPDGQLARAPFENPALATAGTGDVLAGTIGALLAQGLAPFDAACLGVYLHGAAGERVSERVGESGLLASDLPYEIALVRRHLAGVRNRHRAAVGFTRRSGDDR